jgi:hypothetical protein
MPTAKPENQTVASIHGHVKGKHLRSGCKTKVTSQVLPENIRNRFIAKQGAEHMFRIIDI